MIKYIILVMLLFLFVSFPKVHVQQIVIAQIKTLTKKKNAQKVNSDYRISKWQIFCFYVFPIIIGFLLKKTEFKLSADQLNSLLTIFSIFIGFLLNAVVLVYDVLNKETSVKRKSIFKEIYTNISYGILIGIIVVFVTTLNLVFYEKYYLDVVLYFLLGNFILALLIVLNRIYVGIVNIQ